MFGLFKKNSEAIQDKKSLNDLTLVVKTNKCPQNHPCPSIRVCPVGALKQKGYAAPTVDMTLCIKCGKCIRFCPKRALVLE